MKYLCFILYLQVSFKECTIDVSIPEFVYIADHLTAAECRRLFASLHFVSHDLPAALSTAEKKVPKDVPCLTLLMKWNKDEDKWEGKGKTHVDLEHRLRQVGRNDLADWLGATVFNQLSIDLNNSLEDPAYFNNRKNGLHHKILKDPDSRYESTDWSTLDSILCVTLFGLLVIMMTALCRMLRLTFNKSVVRCPPKNREEMIDLLSTGSAESDQEIVYEFDIENEDKRSGDSVIDDIEKTTTTNNLTKEM